jgi:hypothetical protein
MLKTGAVRALFLLVMASSAGGQTPENQGRTTPVALGITLIDFARINIREETFDIEGYLDATWVDPALARPPGAPRLNPRDVRLDPARTPVFEFVNSIDVVKFQHEGIIEIGDDGRVHRRVRFSGKFSTPLDLRHFPFDRQELVVVISVFDPAGDRFDLRIDPGRVRRLRYAFLSDWEIGGVYARIDRRDRDLGMGDGSYFVYRIQVARRSYYYLWRAILPMTLLVMSSWLVFWFEPTNLQPQISTALGILLSLVTFTFSIDISLPKISHLTFLDRHALTSLFFVLATILSVAVIHVELQRRGVKRALLIQWWARRAFPAVFAVAIAGAAVVSFL